MTADGPTGEGKKDTGGNERHGNDWTTARTGPCPERKPTGETRKEKQGTWARVVWVFPKPKSIGMRRAMASCMFIPGIQQI